MPRGYIFIHFNSSKLKEGTKLYTIHKIYAAYVKN